MLRTYRYLTVDVFTNSAFGGNQLAVVLDAEGLTTAEMQAITREFNYSETTFVLPPRIERALRYVRIFTPAKEIPFAGHPTVGTTFVLRREGVVPTGSAETVLEEEIGPVAVRLDASGFIWMQHRLPEWGPIFDDLTALARMLGLDITDLRDDLPAQIVSTGVRFLYIPIRSLEAIRRVRFDVRAVDRVFGMVAPVEVFVFTPEAETPHGTVRSRMFAEHTLGIPEDPATGAASGPLGAYLIHYGVVPQAAETRIVSEQGFEMGRPSLITIDVRTTDGDISDIWIGGETVLVMEGTLYVP
jgi:trans-2,3-dihydro-3-hydroxyanthranilate isomerase